MSWLCGVITSRINIHKKHISKHRILKNNVYDTWHVENVKFNYWIRGIWRFISGGPNESSAFLRSAIQVVGDFRIGDFDRYFAPRSRECITCVLYWLTGICMVRKLVKIVTIKIKWLWGRRDTFLWSLIRTLVFRGGGGGGGGGLHTLVIKILKTQISGQKSTLIFKKRRLFPVKKHPFFYQNSDIGWMGTRILTLYFTILYLFRGSSSGSRLGSPVTSGVTRRQSRGYFVDFYGIFTSGESPPYFVPGYKKVPIFYKSRTCGGLKKKTPSSAKYVTRVRPPSVPECPPRARFSSIVTFSAIFGLPVIRD